jgi:hypothetical protein
VPDQSATYAANVRNKLPGSRMFDCLAARSFATADSLAFGRYHDVAKIVWAAFPCGPTLKSVRIPSGVSVAT